MKFCKQYSEFIEREGKCKIPGCTYVQFKRFKKLLKRCPAPGPVGLRLNNSIAVTRQQIVGPESPEFRQSIVRVSEACVAPKCACPVCDGKFFPELVHEVSAIVGCFIVRAKMLLQRHLAKGIRKYILKLRNRPAAENMAMIEEGRTLVSYASINAMAIRKILKKYDKVHCVVAEQTSPKSTLLAMRIELLQSPWLIELCALHMNLSDLPANIALPEGRRDVICDFRSDSPTVSCTLFDSVKLEVELTCSICLEIIFDPIALKCGHVFCNSCLCTAASIPAYLGVKSADQTAKCPLCRQEGGFPTAIRLPELSILVKNRYHGYWKDRLRKEREQQLLEAKAYWDKQLQCAMGI
eukprot:TRINITY_DN9479_c0_g2_i2.p1 TRINITY_DN9479_c0_g2~~TRINITY_DN9479_c0_g2_i2.p1  ORF type:complete len:353 (-),score=38.02 TRINITY_DN9479_c0_g2_i2:25-1083(-)